MDGMKSGFFLNLFQNVRNGLKSDEIQTFTSLASNAEKIKLVHNVSMVEKKLSLKRHDREQKHRLNDDEIFFYKDLNCAMEMKKIGNKFFQNQQWNEALNFYNKSYIMLPSDSRKYTFSFPIDFTFQTTMIYCNSQKETLQFCLQIARLYCIICHNMMHH
jgi:hypothetical protein